MKQPVEIKDRTGKVLSKGKNLRVLRTWAGKDSIAAIYTKRLPEGCGWLRVEFYGGRFCETEFVDFDVLFNLFLIPCTNFHHAPIYINGIRCGYLGKTFDQTCHY